MELTATTPPALLRRRHQKPALLRRRHQKPALLRRRHQKPALLHRRLHGVQLVLLGELELLESLDLDFFGDAQMPAALDLGEAPIQLFAFLPKLVNETGD